MWQNKAIRVALTLACAISVAGAVSSVAVAAPWSGTEYKVTELLRSDNQINANEVLASCSGGKGFECALTSTYSASRTVQVSLGIKASVVVADLSLGSSTVKAHSASCTWTLPTSSSRLIAYPMGQQVFYKVTKKTYSAGNLTSTTTSGTLMAFKPYSGSLFCARIR